jgi:hypothetical protein
LLNSSTKRRRKNLDLVRPPAILLPKSTNHSTFVLSCSLLYVFVEFGYVQDPPRLITATPAISSLKINRICPRSRTGPVRKIGEQECPAFGWAFFISRLRANLARASREGIKKTHGVRRSQFDLKNFKNQVPNSVHLTKFSLLRQKIQIDQQGASPFKQANKIAALKRFIEHYQG